MQLINQNFQIYAIKNPFLDFYNGNLMRKISKLCDPSTILFTFQDSENLSPDSLTIYTEDVDLIYGISHICVKPSSYLSVDLGVQDEGRMIQSKMKKSPSVGLLLSVF